MDEHHFEDAPVVAVKGSEQGNLDCRLNLGEGRRGKKQG
jgi:hypothetical protein